MNLLRTIRWAGSVLIVLLAASAQACEEDSVALFSCEASNGRKLIQLCAPSPIDAESGFLTYRFSSLGPDGEVTTEELVYPAKREGSGGAT